MTPSMNLGPSLDGRRPVDAGIAARQLLAYCRAEEWAGHDPYDALNSRVFTALPILNSKWPRLVLTQALKRSPVNVRSLMLVPKTQNPKAIALFLSGILKAPEIASDSEDLIRYFTERLVALRSPGTAYWAWGYSFPWQTRTLVVPRGTPNLVCTTFVGAALLDAYERRGHSQSLEMAVSAAEYIVNELYRPDSRGAGFAYPLPSMSPQIHNANFLAATLLARVSTLTGRTEFLEPALAATRASAARQRDDGSWMYGEGDTQQWIDNFHTGYNICALHEMGQVLQTREFDAAVRRGYEFYRNHFLREDGAARYFHNSTYPIDIHCVAQSIITLLALKHLDPDGPRLARSVFDWSVQHMRDKKGYFYYRVLRTCTIRSSYMRWSQAWMLLALARLLSESKAIVADMPTAPAQVVA